MRESACPRVTCPTPPQAAVEGNWEKQLPAFSRFKLPPPMVFSSDHSFFSVCFLLATTFDPAPDRAIFFYFSKDFRVFLLLLVNYAFYNQTLSFLYLLRLY